MVYGAPIAIVTGSNTGIGYQTALSLCKRGYKVIVACRNKDRGEAAVAAITAALRGERSHLEVGEAIFMQIDTSSLHSVRAFSQAFLSNYDHLNALVLSAGMGPSPVKGTADGFSMVFSSNFLGHFYLTQLLLPCLKATADASRAGGGAGGGGAGAGAGGAGGNAPPVRIVCLSSVTHRLVSKAPDWARAITTDSAGSYKLSKLAMIHFAYELQRRLNSQGYGDVIQAIPVNPGGVYSDIWRFLPEKIMCIFRPFMKLFFLNTAQGAATSVAAAADPEPGGRRMKSGELVYLSPYRVFTPSFFGPTIALLTDSLGPFAGARLCLPQRLSYDAVSSASLWNCSDAAVAKVMSNHA
jgi:NAD(P)-dependent dehydrogenase (short-subunit alcohol dehydrogenase family)